MPEDHELAALLAALTSNGRVGDVVAVSLADCARALERYLGEPPPAVGLLGVHVCLTREQLAALVTKAARLRRR